MKYLVLGDTHGRDTWKEMIEKYPTDKVIFIGDYFDSFDVDGVIQMANFKDIIEFRDSRPDDVTLLIGNHDYHYMEGVHESYSGYQRGAGYEIQKLLTENRDKLQFAHSVGRWLFTHAGVTKDWCENNDVDLDNVVESINNLELGAFRFVGIDMYGDSPTSGPIWVRPRSLYRNRIDGWVQAVGHTQQRKLDADHPYVVLLDTIGSGLALLLEEGLDGIDPSVAKIEKPS